MHDPISIFPLAATGALIESLRTRFIARERLTGTDAASAFVSIARGYRWHVAFNGRSHGHEQGRSFIADQLADALAEAEAWLDHDELAEQWAMLGCDSAGRVIEVGWQGGFGL